jgi:predicted RNA-binding Zn ribbon-like protein
VATQVKAHRPPGAIPHTVSAHLCIDFVNSCFTDHTGGPAVHDRLELEPWRQWFARRCGLDGAPPLNRRAHGDLVALRSLLRQLLETRRPPDRAARMALNLQMSRVTQSQELVAGPAGWRLHQRWNGAGWNTLMAAVVASYTRLVIDGDLDLVRTCANPSCSFMFYDETRNASRRWCDVAVCGNLVKVRRHRHGRSRSGSALSAVKPASR